MSYISKGERLSLLFTLKNCQKNNIYKISTTLENSSCYKENFQTGNIKCSGNNSEIEFKEKMLCNFYFDRQQRLKIKIEIMVPIDTENKYKLKINERKTTLSSLITSKNSIYERKLYEKIDDSEIISIKVERVQEENSNIDQNKSLYEYLKSGLKLSCFLSIDFSDNSNNPSLLDTKINYESIFKYLSQTISYYIKNHIFYAYGFNGKIKNSKSKESLFNLNLNEKDSSIQTMDIVLSYFNLCLKKNLIRPEKNINFSSIIKQITQEIYKLYEIRYYNVSFIITRGEISKNDITKAIDSIIESSYLPLSIFIIGVGKNDYSQMKKIFNKNYKISSLGMEKMRDNVLFVSLIDDFSNDAEKLISWCLEELSKQILIYYELLCSSPQKIYENNLKNIEESFNLYNSSVCLERSQFINESDLKKLIEKKASLISGSNIKLFNNNNLPKPNDNNKNEEHINFFESNPYKEISIPGNLNGNNDYKNNSDENISHQLSSKKFVNKMPNIYESVLDNNNKEENLKNKNSNNSIYINTPTPSSSININVEKNPYDSKKSENEAKNDFPTPEIPSTPEDYKNKKFNIPQSIYVNENENDKNDNPYLDNYKKGKIENIEQNNNYIGPKKMNKNFEDITFNSTKVSEIIKESTFSLFNNYSIDGN